MEALGLQRGAFSVTGTSPQHRPALPPSTGVGSTPCQAWCTQRCMNSVEGGPTTAPGLPGVTIRFCTLTCRTEGESCFHVKQQGPELGKSPAHLQSSARWGEPTSHGAHTLGPCPPALESHRLVPSLPLSRRSRPCQVHGAWLPHLGKSIPLLQSPSDPPWSSGQACPWGTSCGQVWVCRRAQPGYGQEHFQGWSALRPACDATCM